MDSEIEDQRHYYASRANDYDPAHVQHGDEHYFALSFLVGVADFLDARSVLDVGAGTGRALEYLARRSPHLARRGVEPVAELRDVAYGKGILREELTAGDGAHLEFPDASFDMVSSFGVLHHVRDHAGFVREMLRVANKAIFISDSNNFGQGGPALRMLKQVLRASGLWSAANFLKTRGKGYVISEGDGLAYSYSVFSDYGLIRSRCRSVHCLNTRGAGINPYRTASHVAVLGIK